MIISEADDLFKYQGPSNSVSIHKNIAGLTETQKANNSAQY